VRPLPFVDRPKLEQHMLMLDTVRDAMLESRNERTAPRSLVVAQSLGPTQSGRVSSALTLARQFRAPRTLPGLFYPG
jgi:hypothetical protein